MTDCIHPDSRYEPAGPEASLRGLPSPPEGELWGMCRDCGAMSLIGYDCPVTGAAHSSVSLLGQEGDGTHCVYCENVMPGREVSRRWIEPVAADLKEPLPERDAAIMRASGPVSFQWTEGTAPRQSIALDALAGPSEAMEAAGLTNRGSLAWAMKERGFPQPVKVLRGIRLWDLNAVTAWKDAQ